MRWSRDAEIAAFVRPSVAHGWLAMSNMPESSPTCKRAVGLLLGLDPALVTTRIAPTKPEYCGSRTHCDRVASEPPPRRDRVPPLQRRDNRELLTKSILFWMRHPMPQTARGQVRVPLNLYSILDTMARRRPSGLAPHHHGALGGAGGTL